jgi:hypothetical protein
LLLRARWTSRRESQSFNLRLSHSLSTLYAARRRSVHLLPLLFFAELFPAELFFVELLLVELLLAVLAERVLALAADLAALLVLLATLLAACAVLVVTLLAASASFRTSRLFSRAPLWIVFCAEGALAFLPRRLLLLPPGMTELITGVATLDTALAALPAMSDAWFITSPATSVVWSNTSRPASIASFSGLLARFLAINVPSGCWFNRCCFETSGGLRQKISSVSFDSHRLPALKKNCFSQ